MKQWIVRAAVLLVLGGCDGDGAVASLDSGGGATDAVGSDLGPDAGPAVTDGGALDAGSDDVLDAASDLGDLPPSSDAGVGCRDNTDCSANEFGFRVCEASTGTCVACSSANRGSCTVGQYCTAANRCEVGCAADSDCASDAGTFRCDVMRHVCVGCTRDDQCSAGSVCGTAATCVPGCNDRQACPDAENCCSGQCRRVQGDISNCGTCGRTCSAPNGASACALGQCTVAACNPGFGDCDAMPTNGCETDTNTAGSHCGQCGRACPMGPNATPVCASGRCGLLCATGFADCDGDSANGCEVDTQTTAGHCGMCGAQCSAGANATGRCAMGRCAVACSAGFGDCDNNPANGCEANLQSDTSRCGTCSTSCAGGTNGRPVCAMGVCQVECLAGFANCDGSALNGCEASLDGTATCGRCGGICAGGTPLCSPLPTGGFGCSTGCAAGLARCGGSCTDTQGDVTDCGMCGNACPSVANAARGCTAGRCGFACNPGFADCDTNPANGCEVFLGTDARHCGACRRVCSQGSNAQPTCALGVCGLVCAQGFGDCDASASNGCESDTRTSPSHCGVCGRQCPSGPNSTATCASAICGLTCATGFADCDRNPANGCEVNLASSATHCGACGVVCASGTTCLSGACGSLATCATIHTAQPTAPSGLFMIDPDGPGGIAALQVYCDMATDGGGWTLVAYASRGAVSAQYTNTGIRNLYSLATGGGTYDGIARRDVASLAAVPIARRSREMLLSRSNADLFTGPIGGYDVATKFDIPNPATVNFLNSNPAVNLPERGPCIPVTITTVRGPNATGARRYVFQNTLSVSWTDTYPTSYGVMDSSSCYNGSLGPNYVSDYTGIGNTRNYGWPLDARGGAYLYWHLGWWDPTRTSNTGSVAIWLR